MKIGKYFAGSNEEYLTVGPEDTEESAIAEFRDDNEDADGCFVGVSKDIVIDLNVGDCLDNWANSDGFYEDFYSDFYAQVTPAKEKDLKERINKVANEWASESLNMPYLIGDIKWVEFKK